MDELRRRRFFKKIERAIRWLIKRAEAGELEPEVKLGTKRLGDGTTAELRLVMRRDRPAYGAQSHTGDYSAYESRSTPEDDDPGPDCA